MSAVVLPFSKVDRGQRVRRIAAIRASINSRAAYLQVAEHVRRKWEAHGLKLFDEGSTAPWAIAEAVRGMMDEHRKGTDA